MVAALLSENVLQSPTVGRWFPTISEGAALTEGMHLGRIWQSRKWINVLAPKGAQGFARHRCDKGEWCQRGTPLLSIIEAGHTETEDIGQKVATEGECPRDCVPILSDTDGTVYLRADPQSAAFVAEGKQCASKDTLALVEVMKTFTAVRAPNQGEVVSIRVEDGASVTSGEALFWFRPISH